ncbi:unnamed protein product [Closterium sp. NIES-65]|nr:unnamed protein product [Closterium sp. NIES-65]
MSEGKGKQQTGTKGLVPPNQRSYHLSLPHPHPHPNPPPPPPPLPLPLPSPPSFPLIPSYPPAPPPTHTRVNV